MPALRPTSLTLCLYLVALIASIAVLNKSGFHIYPRDQRSSSTKLQTAIKSVYQNLERMLINDSIKPNQPCLTEKSKSELTSHDIFPELEYFNENILKIKQQKEAITKLLSKEPINNFNISYKFGQWHRCVNFTPEVVFITPSYVFNFDRRDNVRKSKVAHYVKDHSKSALRLFFVGLPSNGINEEDKERKMKRLNEEMNEYDDIVVVDFVDIYKNILIKHVSMLQWLATLCPHARFAIRLDDDIANQLNPAELVASMRRHRALGPHFILGRQRSGDIIHRGNNPRYFVSYEDFNEERWPPFVLGGAIGYPVPTTSLLLRAARRIRAVWLDDVFITGICSRALAVPTYNEKSFQFTHPGS